jgi:hypothetical protein
MSKFLDRIREWIAVRAEKEELRRLGDQEVYRIARDTGVGANELYQLNRLGSRTANLLPRRLKSLGLDPDEISDRRPALTRDMQRVCTFCQRHGTCARDLARPLQQDGRWKTYCPNAATIEALTMDAAETV